MAMIRLALHLVCCSSGVFTPTLNELNAQSLQVDWTLDRVTCHEVGALLQFEGAIQAAGGERKALLTGLPSDVDVSSAQIELPDGIRLVAVNKVTTTEDVSEDLVWLEKQVEAQRLALDLEMALLEAIDQERAYLEANRSIGGGSEVLLVDDVEEMRHYLAQRHQELALDRVDIASNIRALEAQLIRAESDLSTAKANDPVHALEVVVSGAGRGNAVVQVATQRAGWVSSYAVSWDNRTGQLDIQRYARVVQTTGLDWSDVELELRTGHRWDMPNDVPSSRNWCRPRTSRTTAIAPTCAG